MPEDITAQVFAGVERMLAVQAASVLASVEKMIEAAVKQMPASPAGPPGEKGETGPPGERGDNGVVGERGNDGLPGRDGVGIQGPAGERGADGAASTVPGPRGERGERGADGIATLEELDARIEARFADVQVRNLADWYRDVYRADAAYTRGLVVTYDGQLWLALADSKAQQPGTSAAWKLITKKGRDGRDKT